MEQLCSICNRDIQNFPTTELLCHHVCHTTCFLNNIRNAEELHFLSCVTCERPVFGDEVADEEEEEEEEQTELVEEVIEQPDNLIMTDENNQSNRVNRLFERNEQFRKDLKKYMLASRACAQPYKAFQKIVTAKKTELKPRYAQIKAMYEGLYHTKKNELIASDEYKNYRKADAKMKRYWNLLREKYDVRGNSLQYLTDKKGFKTLHRPYWSYRRSCQSIIRRALRLRIPWY